MARSAILNIMVQAAIKAGRLLNREYGEVQNLQVALSGLNDYVAKIRAKAEKIILAELSRARPTYGIVTEAGGGVVGVDTQHRFFVAALDGETNFLHGIPSFAVCIALERQDAMMAAVVYEPVSDSLFTAERGSGAFLNDRRLRVAARRRLEECVIGSVVPHLGSGHHGQYLLELRNIMGEAAGVRAFGAPGLALAYVASGRLDGFWQADVPMANIAASLLLLREAGAFVTDKQGSSFTTSSETIIAANEVIHRIMVKTLQKPV